MSSNINKIKVFGERNSGTNFIGKLLRNNLKNNKLVLPNKFDHWSGWKHGKPNLDKFNVEDTLFVFIIRDLEEWLNSMYENPHHIKKRKNFRQFISKKIEVGEKKKNHDVNKFDYERENNLFQLRYHKYDGYLNVFNNSKNAIMLNLSWIQKPGNDLEFLKKLEDEFNLEIKDKKTRFLKKNVKRKNNQINSQRKNRRKIPCDVAKNYIDFEKEREIRNLTISINNND